jgi:sec-independent protein translocase protein TatA
MFGALEPWHLIILVAIMAVLFGAKRLPDSARSIGQSLRIFRSEMDAARTTPEPSIQLPHPVVANQQDRASQQSV